MRLLKPTALCLGSVVFLCYPQEFVVLLTCVALAMALRCKKAVRQEPAVPDATPRTGDVVAAEPTARPPPTDPPVDNVLDDQLSAFRIAHGRQAYPSAENIRKFIDAQSINFHNNSSADPQLVETT